jgi:NAD(P)-dependent dehydrogenase (short-subunit alcohol dehydrogenase family)
MAGEFEGRVVVVTGGAQGIGHAVVEAFAAEGASAVSLDVREVPGARYLLADVTKPVDVADAFSSLERIDVLVNNAGNRRVGLVGDMSFEAWSEVLATHLSGAFLCDTEAVRRMRRQGAGSIVHVSSGAAFVALPGRAAYSAAKAGLLALTRVMAVELAPAGIRVNAVAPGHTLTPAAREVLEQGLLEPAWIAERVPLARLASPAEIAAGVCFLASDRASFVTGQCLQIDGGWTIQGIGHVPGWLAGSGEPSA